MAAKLACILVLALGHEASAMKLENPKLNLASIEAPHLTLAKVGQKVEVDRIAEMGQVFARSPDAHRQAMLAISSKMTDAHAVDVIKNSNVYNASQIAQVTKLMGNKNLRSDSDGFGGLDGARKLLNDMIYEAMVMYDKEIAKCTDYYAKQCALMEIARGQISAANYVAATARTLILDAQNTINHMEVSIPDTKKELKDHNRKCKIELKKLNDELKIVMEDISLIVMILEMSDCDKKLLQMDKLQMLRCHNQCTNSDYITFNHKTLDEKVQMLKSPESKKLLTDTFADFFNDDDVSSGSMELVQVTGSDYLEVTNKTQFNNPPLPRTKVPANPCTDPYAGAPPPANKRGGKCTLKKSPRCYKLQGRFLQIQGEIADERDELMDQIDKLTRACKETKKTLENSIQNDAASLQSAQTKLAEAMGKESEAGETGRQVAKENQQYNDDLVKQMKICSTNYGNMEGELCALKKIRGDLFKKKSPGHTGFFQDCEVSPWSAEACTKVCDPNGVGGQQKLIRSVIAHPGPPKGPNNQGPGAKCLPLAAERTCNRQPCPINCVLAQWSGWNKCSSKCGGGMSQRVRDVKIPMRYEGKQCGSTTETKQCNVAACSKDCVLSKWTRFTTCSKDCDGGTQKRQKNVKEPAEGEGKCADKWDPTRLQYKPCNNKRCVVPDPTKVMKCTQFMDIVMLLDGTPKSGKDGWAAEVKAATQFVDAFAPEGSVKETNTQFALLHYTGPRTWSGVSKCTGNSKKKVDMEKTCKVTLVQHFTNDLKKVKNKINGMSFQPGCKLLSLALSTTKAEFALGNKLHRTVVVVFVDGAPLSFRKTKIASHQIRKAARLVYVVVAKFSPLKDYKKWSSRRWQENIVTVESADDLVLPETGTHLVANICPKEWPKLMPLSPTPSSAPKKCANENGKCKCSGTVYYGKRFAKGKPGEGDEINLDQLKAGKHKMKKDVTGSIQCSNGVFGDPLPGFYKQCYCA